MAITDPFGLLVPPRTLLTITAAACIRPIAATEFGGHEAAGNRKRSNYADPRDCDSPSARALEQTKDRDRGGGA